MCQVLHNNGVLFVFQYWMSHTFCGIHASHCKIEGSIKLTIKSLIFLNFLCGMHACSIVQIKFYGLSKLSYNLQLSVCVNEHSSQVLLFYIFWKRKSLSYTLNHNPTPTRSLKLLKVDFLFAFQNIWELIPHRYHESASILIFI